MNTHRPPSAGDQPGDDLLARLLAAAAAPAHQEELAGEEAAVAAFRQVGAGETGQARPSGLRRVFATVLTVKAVVALAITGSAGVVLAATGGVLPAPWSAPPATEQAPAPAPTVSVVPTTTRGSVVPPTGPGRGAAAAEPAVVDLCRTYPAGEGAHRDDPKFRPLVEAAGGKDEVAEYCATHAPRSSKKPAKNEPAKGAEPGHPHTGKPGHNKPENPPDNSGGATPSSPPEQSGKPGKNPPGPPPPESGNPPDHGAGATAGKGEPPRGRPSR